jgi:hypothetical protein
MDWAHSQIGLKPSDLKLCLFHEHDSFYRIALLKFILVFLKNDIIKTFR